MSQENLENKVLALKYRPSKFEDLIGQDSISSTLSLALDKDRLSHAYLFSGLRGSGKTSTARIMAKALVCKNAPTSKPCEVCSGCLSANEGRHLDIVEMDAASNRGIDDIKDLIEHTKYRPTSAKYKIFIIDEVHMLTTQAFNALLKTLEEPPAFVKFILATTDPLKVPATILSRTQHFRFKKISEQNVFHHLVHILNLENIAYENEALNILIRSGQGSLRDTLTLLDQAIIYSKSGVSTSAVTDMMGMIDPSFMDTLFDSILKGRDTREYLEILESYEAGQVIDEISIYLKHKMLTRDVRFATYLFDRFFRILGDAKELLKQNSDGGFVIILTLMKLEEASWLKTIEEIIEETKGIIPKQNERQNNQNAQTNTIPIATKNENISIELEKTNETQKSTNFDIPPNVFIEEKDNTNNEENLNLTNYQKVTDLIFDRNYDLGVCFTKSFIFNSFEENILTIDSYADDESRKLLNKNFAYIRGFIEDIFGNETEIKFNKIDTSKQKELPQNITPKDEQIEVNLYDHESDSGSMIEDIELGSGCVANMGMIVAPSFSQKELKMDDILNSKFVNKAIELFQPESQLRVKSKL